MYKVIAVFSGVIVACAFIFLFGYGTGWLIAGIIDPSLTLQDWQNVNPLARNKITWDFGLPMWLWGTLYLLVFAFCVWIAKKQNIVGNIRKLWNK